MWVLASLLVTYLGFALLALRQPSHFRAVAQRANGSGAAPSATLRTRLLWLGGASVAAGGGGSWLAEGPSLGSLLWALILAVAGVAVTFTLTWRPGWLRCLLGS